MTAIGEWRKLRGGVTKFSIDNLESIEKPYQVSSLADLWSSLMRAKQRDTTAVADECWFVKGSDCTYYEVYDPCQLNERAMNLSPGFYADWRCDSMNAQGANNVFR